jgi:hypothetical protein
MVSNALQTELELNKLVHLVNYTSQCSFAYVSLCLFGVLYLVDDIRQTGILHPLDSSEKSNRI